MLLCLRNALFGALRICTTFVSVLDFVEKILRGNKQTRSLKTEYYFVFNVCLSLFTISSPLHYYLLLIISGQNLVIGKRLRF